jgi:hypothetical protein
MVAAKTLFVQTPLYVLKLAPRKVSGYGQYMLIQWILAHSTSAIALGKEQSEWTEPLNNPTWQKLLGLEEGGVRKILRDAVRRGLIDRDPEDENDNPRAGYRYRVTSEARWKAAPDYQPEPAEKPKPAEAEADEPEDAHNKDAAAQGAGRSVRPGKQVTISFEEPARKIEYQNEVPVPLQIFTTAVRHGVAKISVSVSDKLREMLSSLSLSEDSTVNLGYTAVQGRKGEATPSTVKQGYTAVQGRKGESGSPSVLPKSGLRARLVAELDSYDRAWGGIEDSLWAQIARELSDMPEEEAEERFYRKIDLARRKRYKVYPGLVLVWAQDIRRDFARHQQENKPQIAVERSGPPSLQVWCKQNGVTFRTEAELRSAAAAYKAWLESQAVTA